MPNKKFNLVFDASMNISQVKTAVGEIQKSLSGVSMPQNISTRFTKTFEKLNQEIANFEQQAAKGLNEIGDFKNITKAGRNILKYYQDIQNTVRQLGNLSDKELAKLFPADVSAKIEKANKAMQEYSSSVKKTESDIEKQNKAVAKQMAAVGKLKTELDELKKVKPATDDQFKDIRTQIISAQNALEAYKKEQKSIYEENLAIKQGKEKEFEAKGKSPENLKFSQPWREANKVVEEYNQTVAESTLKIEQLKQVQKSLVSKEELGLKIEEKNTELENARKKLVEVRAELEKMRGAGNSEAFSKLIQEIGKIEGIDVTKLQTIDDVSKALSSLNTNALEQIRQNMSGVVQNTEQAGPAFRNLAGNIDSAESSFKQFNSRAREVENLKEQIAYFFGLSNSIELFKRAVRSAYETVKELDEVMTQTAVVTDFTVGDMWSQLPEYTQRANELGVAVKGAYESATLYYQQGLDTNEVVAVSSETLKMARIAGMDYAEATNYMTAALRGFNMEINETNAQRINDVYSELAAITASDTQEIATAMTKTASIASNAGMEFETTAAFLSQIIETTREAPETAGTALKTVIARFQELKKDPLEIGEVDGEAVDANKIETALRTIDVALRDTNGQFRDLDDVFLDIAQKWDGLDTNTQRYIATIAAGSRQQSRFIAMMSNYARTIELVGAANDSTGASQRQFEKTLDSLESKLAKLENAWNEFTMGLANNTAIKFGVDAVTLLLNIINDLTGILPEGIDGIAKLGIALLGMRAGGQIIDNFFLNLKGNMGPAAASVKAVKQSFVSLTATLAKFNKEQLIFNSLSEKSSFNILTNTAAKILNVAANNKLIKSTKAAALAEGLLGKAAMSTGAKLAVSLGTIGLIVGAVAVLGFGVKKLYDIIKSQSPEEKFKQLQNAAEEAGEAANEVSSQYIELKDNLTSLEEKYEIIDNFTAGTQAWRDAVQETNNQVLDLIEKYKELAKYVKIEDGVLTLDFESPEVQNIITGYEDKAKEAKVISASAEIALEQITRENLVNNLDRDYKIKGEKLVGNSSVSVPIYYSNEELQEVAKQYASGKIGANDTSDKAKIFRELGQQILNSEALEAVQYKSLVSEILKDLDGNFTSEQIQGMGNIVTSELINNLIEQSKAELDFNRAESISKYATALGYSEKEGFEIQGNKINYLDENNQEQSITVTDEQLKLSEASILATDKLAEAMLQMPSILEDKLLGAFYSSNEGRGITNSDLDAIEAAGGVKAYAAEEWENLAPEIQKLYGNNEANFEAFLQESVDFASSYYKKAENAVQELGVDFEILDLHETLSSGAVEGLSKQFVQVFDQVGKAGTEEIFNKLDIIFDNLDEEQANKFAAALNAIDWTNADSIAQLSNNLVGFGTELGLTEAEVFELEQEFIRLAGAIREVDVATLLTQTKSLRDTADEIRDRETVEGITQEEYDLIAGTNKFDMSQFEWTGQNYILTNGTMGQLADVLDDIAGQLAIEGAATDTTNNAQLRQEALLAKNSAIKISADSSYTKEEQRRAIETIKKNEELASSITAISKAYKGNSREFNNFDNHLVDVAINSKEAAKNFGGLNDVVKNNIEILKDPSSNPQGYLDTINSLSEKATEAFGTEVNTDFIQDNLIDFISIGEGGEKAEEAYKKLGKKIAESFLEGIEDINDGLSFTIDEVVTFIESQYPELKVGGSFDASAIFEQFAKTAEGAAQLQSILNSLGYSSSFDISYDLIQKNSAGKLTGRARGVKQENLQWFLDHGYEISKRNFDSLATKIDPSEFTIDPPSGGGGGSKSTSEWKNPYDKQYNTIEEINEELRKREILEKNFQRLQDQGKTTALTTLDYYNKLYKNLEGQLPLQEKLLKGRREELADLIKKNTQYAKYGSYNEATGLIQIDWDLIDSIKKTDTKTGEAVEKYISEFERIAGSIEDVKGEILDIKQQQQDIKQELTDAFLSFEERVANAMEAAAQKDIDAMQEEFDALTEAEEALADAISKSIDEMRQARENEKTEDEIAEKERRLAYLRQDTTGSNALEIKRLEEEIAEQREEYQDALVDQALTNLQAQNEAAAEQRERQIELAQSQLEYNVENGVYVKQVAGLIESAMEGDHMLTKDDKLYEILHKGEDWSKLSEAGFQEMFRNLGIELNKAFSKLKADFAQDEDLTQFSGDYMAEMIRRYNENGGILTQDILGLNDLRNAKIEDPSYTGSQETLTPAELEEILKQHYTGSSSSRTSNSGTSAAGTTKTYIVKAGDSLSKIARDELGDMNRWKEIASLNKIPSPYTIYPNQKLELPAYKTGGIADFTGPAWLDGSKSKPELILNARDTENFIMLKDILSGVLNNASNIKSKSGDNYFDIDIQVDEIANDYDVDQMAERIKQNIYEDSTYRNVNAINLLR